MRLDLVLLLMNFYLIQYYNYVNRDLNSSVETDLRCSFWHVLINIVRVGTKTDSEIWLPDGFLLPDNISCSVVASAYER